MTPHNPPTIPEDFLKTKRQDGHLRYRPDIDGLRAIAVLSVILFHTKISFFHGGFIGVDIFFVISGFLITTLLIGEHKVGNFSVIRFYERRARRILPALFVVLIVTTVATFLTMVPHQLQDYGKSLVSVCLFASNFFFWKTTGYFDAVTEEKPLLHTWSLGIEEQYYVIFPLVLMLAWRFGAKRLVGGLSIFALLSLFVSEYGWPMDPSASFYLPCSRAFELLIGSLLALISFDKSLGERTDGKIASALAGMGLILIAATLFVFDKNTHFPGFHALMPTLGTALVIGYAGPNNLVGKILSRKSIVGIGLISYSAYLWHQSLFAFARVVSLDTAPRLLYAGLSVITLGLAFVTWKFVETPFREKTKVSGKTIFWLSLVFSATFVVLGATLSTLSEKTGVSEEAQRPNHGLASVCDYQRPFDNDPSCSTSPNPEMMVWGDSVAMHLVSGFLASNPRAGVVQTTRSLCAPILGISYISLDEKLTEERAKECVAFNDSVLSFLQKSKSVQIVVLSGNFSKHMTNSLFFSESQSVVSPSLDFAVQRMGETIKAIRQSGKKVILFSPPPTDGLNSSDCWDRKGLNKPTWTRHPSCEGDYAMYKKFNTRAIAFLDRVEKEFDVSVVRFDDFLCKEGRCLTRFDGTPLYRDSTHFSHPGAALLGQKMGFWKIITDKAL